jgi:beta-glucosidase
MLSRVDSQGNRAVAPGTYRICLGGSQPGGDGDHLAAEFTIEGTLGLPR